MPNWSELVKEIGQLGSPFDILRRKYKLGSDRFTTEGRTWQWLVQARKAA